MNKFRLVVDFACVAAPKVANGLCLVFLNISLMGWLGPVSFGVYALCLSGISLLAEGFFGAAIDMGVLRLAPLYLHEDPDRAIRIERAALRLKLHAIGSLALAMLLAAAPLSQVLFQREGTAHLIAIMCAAATSVLLLSSGLLHLQIRGYFWQYGVVDTVHFLLKFGGIVSVLFVMRDAGQSLGPVGVLMWFVVGPLGAYVLFLSVFGKYFFRPVLHDHSYVELLEFVKWFLATILLSSLVARMDMFFLTTLTTIDEVGIFAGGQTIASIPLLIGNYLCVVLSPRVMPYFRSGKLYGHLRDVQACLLGLSVFVYGILFWNRDILASQLLPQSFAPSAVIILILLPNTLAAMISFPLAVTFLMFVRPRFIIRLECFLLPFAIVAYGWMVYYYGAIGAALVTTVFGIIKTIVALTFAFHWSQMSPEELDIARLKMTPQS